MLLRGADETLGREDTADSMMDLSEELVAKWRKMTGREVDDLSVVLLLEVE